MLTYAILNKTNPEYDEKRILDLEALYAGGKKFEARLRNNLLPRGIIDPPEIYEIKVEAAKRCVNNYFSNIINQYAGWLFNNPIVPRVVSVNGTEPAPEWYSEWKEDCDGAGTDFHDFMRLRFCESLVGKRSAWRVLSDLDVDARPLSKGDIDELGGAKNIRVQGFSSFEIRDWKKDDKGNLDWIVLRKVQEYRDSPFAVELYVHEFYYVYDKTNFGQYEFKYPKDRKPDPKAKPFETIKWQPHGFDFVPVVLIDLPAGEYVGDKLLAPQLRNLEMSFAHLWQVKKATFTRMRIRTENPDDVANMFSSASMAYVMGIKDELTWLEPVADHLSEIRESEIRSKDELYRSGNVAYMSTENKTYDQSRSGIARAQDAGVAYTSIRTYGAIVRDAVERTCQLISDILGDEIRWSVEGFEKFAQIETGDWIQALEKISKVPVPPTARKLITEKACLSLLSDIDETLKEKIKNEESEMPESKSNTIPAPPNENIENLSDNNTGA